MNPVRALRLAFARWALERANRALLAYDNQPAGAGWSMPVSYALRTELHFRERALCRLVNGW